MDRTGIFAYEKIFCRDHKTPPPYMLLIMGHGFGGNYDRFGRGGLLGQVARCHHKLPNFLMEGNHGRGVWGAIYHKIHGAGPEYLSHNWQKRELWKRKPNCRASVSKLGKVADSRKLEDD